MRITHFKQTEDHARDARKDTIIKFEQSKISEDTDSSEMSFRPCQQRSHHSESLASLGVNSHAS